MQDSEGAQVAALARGLELVRVVGDAPGPLSNRELADATGIPKATVSRLTATLVAAGYLRQAAESERFSLGPALLHLSHRYLSHFDLRAVIRHHLTALADATGASVHVGVRDDLDILITDTIRPRSAIITSRMEVGSRMTIATSAAGRAYLASLDGAEQAHLLERIRLASGEGWKELEPRLLASIDEHARLGYSSSFGEWHPHIHALGFSVLGPQGERYAFSCGGPAYLLPRETLTTQVAPMLLATIAEIRGEIGPANGR